MTYYDRAASFKPALVRLLARDRRYGKAMTSDEVWLRCPTLARAEVEAISQSTSWKGIDLDHIREFTQACNVDLTDSATMRRMTDYLRKGAKGKGPTFKYLVASPGWSDYFYPLLIKWRKSYGVVTADNPPGLWKPLRKLLIRLNPLIKV
jgi:hypothetical protein